MPLPFAPVCDLLENGYNLALARKSNASAVVAWFARHRDAVNAHDTEIAALLSTLLPEKRVDRVYCIQARSLEKIIGRALLLGSSRIAELAAYRQPGLGLDLADCVERILNATPNPAIDGAGDITVEEIDRALHSLASTIKWSSPAVRCTQTPLSQKSCSGLESIYQRLGPREAKWFTRLVLKNYQPLIFDARLVYGLCDPVLPSILKIRDDFGAALDTIATLRSHMLPNSSRREARFGCLLSAVKPQLGVKVGRQLWRKARSIKHCLDMGHGLMSVESKVDGEYCQIHVDLSRGTTPIQIFSKSGKDSTEDRLGLHSIVTDALKLGKDDCVLRKGCILEGELVIYSDLEHKILPFHKIRKHITRRGRFMNTEADSQPKSYEHLMIVFFDILLEDDQSLLNTRHSDRFKRLSRLVHCQFGRSELVQRQLVDFSKPIAASHLRNIFSKTIVERKEGLVLKPDEGFFDLSSTSGYFYGSPIKLKKEYIGTFGEVGDFAVVGAGFDAAKAKNYKITGLKWTHFFIGCLNNREEVRRWNSKPDFTIINAVEINESLLRAFNGQCNPMAVPIEENTASELHLDPLLWQQPTICWAFGNPQVFDMRCFSFEKGGNTGYWSLRFPVVSKIHFDREFVDAVTFEELQDMAEEAVKAPTLEDSQENLEWIRRLESADPRGRGVDAVSQLTVTTESTPSPRRIAPPCCIQSQSTVSSDSSKRLASSPEMQRLPLPATRLFAVTAPPLMTPPTSSAPQETTPVKLGRGHTDKRRLPSSDAGEQPKRQKLDTPDGLSSSSQARKSTTNKERRPLSDTDGNSSQKQSAQLPSAILEDPGVADIGATTFDSSPTESKTQGPTLNAAPARHGSRSDGDETIITILDSEEESYEVEPFRSPQAEMCPCSPCEIRQRCRCASAGSSCALQGVTILLSPRIASRIDVKRLLTPHKIQEPVTAVHQWLSHSFQTLSGENGVPKEKVILLVETLAEKEQTKAYWDGLQRKLDSLDQRRCSWISVYDWRILEHLTRKEDSSIRRKGYDGFKDPWSRWWCGVI